MLLIAWLATPREYLPDFLRRAGYFRGPNDNAARPTAYWIETLRDSPDLQDRRDAVYALAMIGADSGLDREAEEVVPLLLAGMKDQDEWIRNMSRNALIHLKHIDPRATAALAVDRPR
jgi:hypothetical protein